MSTIFITSLSDEKITPAFKERNVPLCLSSSNYYAPFCGTLIYSVIKNSQNENNYDIIIFERDISEENKRLLLSLITEKTNFSIRFINISELAKNMTIPVHGHFSIDCCSKLFLLSDLFSNYDKVIATDSDLVFCRDAHELFITDVSNSYFAAVDDVIMKSLIFNGSLSGGNGTAPKLPAGQYINEYLNMGTSDIYFNTGVVVFNLSLCRQNDIFDKCYKLINEKAFWFLEQDVLNEVCGKNCTKLSLRWNVLNGNGSLDEIKNCLSEELYDELTDSLNNYYIMHFAGSRKPWFEPYISYSEVFYKFARETPWYEFILFVQYKRMMIGNIRKELANGKFNLRQKISLKQRVKNGTKKIAGVFLPKGTERRTNFKATYINLKDKSLAKSRKEMLYRISLFNKAGTLQNESQKALKKLKNKFKGQRCFIIGTGPSLTTRDLEKLKGEVTFSLNSIYKLFDQTDWRPDYYVNNDITLSYKMTVSQDTRKRDLEKCLDMYKFKQIFLSSSKYDEELSSKYDNITFLPAEDFLYQFVHRSNPKFSKNCSRKVYAYGTTVYLIFQLAVYMGFNDIYLLGTDCSYLSSNHHAYEGDHTDKLLYGNAEKARRLTAALEKGFNAIKKNQMKLKHVNVYNATRGGNLELFPRVNLDELISRKNGESK